MPARPLVRSPLSLLALLVLSGMAWAVMGRSSGLRNTEIVLPPECGGLTPTQCQSLLDSRRSPEPPEPEERVLSAGEACVNAGYLCAEVEKAGSLRLARWEENTALIRVLIPEPQNVSPDRGREFQRAAARGLQAWHGHPFPLSIRTRDQGDTPDVRIEWRRTLDEGRLGRAQTQWLREGAEIRIHVLGFTVATHHPRDPDVELTPRQVELVTAHEMGHVLGLPHSDDPRDLMYPENTAAHLSARDYRTLHALYALPNGARIRR